MRIPAWQLMAWMVVTALLFSGCGGKMSSDGTQDETERDSTEEDSRSTDHTPNDTEDPSEPQDEEEEPRDEGDEPHEEEEQPNDQEEPSGFDEDLPRPSVALIPERGPGNWPEQMNRDETTVSALLIRELMSAPYHVQLHDYEMHRQMMHEIVEQEHPEHYLTDDIFLGFSVIVEEVGEDQVRASVKMRSVLVATRDVIAQAQATSEVVAANRRDAAVAQITTELADQVLRTIAETYNHEYGQGIPYRVKIGNVQTDEAIGAIRSAVRELASDQTIHQWEVRESEVRFVLRSEHADTIEFASRLGSSLGEAGIAQRRGSSQMAGRRIAFEIE